MKLHIVDISTCIHTGAVIKKVHELEPVRNEQNRYVSPSYPIGGPSYLFNIINSIPKGDAVIFVADREATRKKEFDPSYKSNREFKRDIFGMKQVAEEILEDCGFVVLSEEGYEADDLEYTICEKYVEEYSKIILHTDDSDMYICVRDGVECAPVRSSGKYVTKDNYEYTVKKGEIIPYNSLSFCKMIIGDSSDGIPGLPKDQQRKAYSLLNLFKDRSKFREEKFIREFVDSYLPFMRKQVDMVMPIFRPDLEIPVVIPEPNRKRINEWATVLKNYKFAKVNQVPESVLQMADSFYEKYF